MTKLSPTLLRELREKAVAASTEKRFVERQDWEDGSTTWEVHTEEGFVAFTTYNYKKPMRAKMDAELFAAANPTTVLSLLDAIATMKETMEYFVARCEIDPVKGMHPDGFIRSKKTYGKFKAALAAIFDEEG